MTDAVPVAELHPAVVHHVVNTLGWRSLRPLQQAAIEPVLAGEHALLMAPTAGGKTEAAVLPLMSRMLTEDWRGLGVLYVCPLRALLNNLHVRLDGYLQLIGRRAGLWHGDIGPGDRRRMLDDPPDLLLTTPESLEGMLVSARVDHPRFFADLHTVVIDEVHAFAGDDRGWHLLAVLERLQRLAGRPLQRVALSATVGNPDDLLGWLTRTTTGPRRVVNPPAPPGPDPEITLDHVGTLENAAVVISRMHRGDKRLVFVDSRARAESLAHALRGHGTLTFVSHGSLGRDERRMAEQAFAEGRDCVIVATSTLELGIDVGDLDHVIQIDSPGTVAGFLQRLGRTGRRPGTSRSMLFLATGLDSLVQAAGLLALWRQGFVEPVAAPPLPLHLAAQQLLALTLQERGVGRRTWTEWLGEPCVLGDDVGQHLDEITDHLVETGMLADDGGILGMGTAGEETYGRRNYLDLLAAFTSPPMLSARHGPIEIGLVDQRCLLTSDPGMGAGGPQVLLLGGRSWQIAHVDWSRRVVDVVPSEHEGRAKWWGTPQPMGGELCRSIRSVLAGTDPPGVELSKRAFAGLAEARAAHPWATEGTTTLVRDATGKVRWWTFAGLLANAQLAPALAHLRKEVAAIDNRSIALDPSTTLDDLAEALKAVQVDELQVPVDDDAVEALKFSDCLPGALAAAVLIRRLDDRPGAVQVVQERRAGWHVR